MRGKPVGYLHNEDLNSGLQRTNPDSGRVEDLNQGPPDFNSSALNHSVTLPLYLLIILIIIIIILITFLCCCCYRETKEEARATIESCFASPALESHGKDPLWTPGQWRERESGSSRRQMMILQPRKIVTYCRSTIRRCRILHRLQIRR